MILLALALASLCSPAPPLNPEQILNDLRSPGLQGNFTGDMIISQELWMYGIKDVRFRWPGYPGAGRIPYVIDPSLAALRPNITAAMEQYHTKTCIRFVPRTTQKEYIKIVSLKGCWAHVGRNSQEKMPLLVSLGKGCEDVGTIVHEFGHVIGFFHEENRSDRDTYLNVHKENLVEDQRERYFFKLDKKSELIFNAFDYNSIMTNSNYALSYNGKKTMEAKNGHPLTNANFKRGLNWSDVERVNKLYKCE